MKVYVMRHGQTVWNAIGRIQGWSANRLSELGKEQVRNRSEELKHEKIDVIFSSPLMRTMQTANIMNLPHKVKVIKDDRLIEKKKGVFVGRFKNTLTEQEKKLRKENPKVCGEETSEEMFERLNSFVDFLKGNYKNKDILIVTHSYTAQILQLILSGKKFSNEELAKIPDFKNAEVKIFEI